VAQAIAEGFFQTEYTVAWNAGRHFDKTFGKNSLWNLQMVSVAIIALRQCRPTSPWSVCCYQLHVFWGGVMKMVSN
jgi:hypothetical protein